MASEVFEQPTDQDGGQEVRLHVFSTQLQCTHMTQTLEGISAEIENRLQQISEVHDFVDEMTSKAGAEDVILICGDFNMFMQPLSSKAEALIHKHNSWAA